MARKKRTVTVTGASGFVGRHLVTQLLRDGDVNVRCLLRPGRDTAFFGGRSASLGVVYGDITRPQSLQAAFEGSWAVVNLAGYRDFWSRQREDFYTVNELGARNVFEAYHSQLCTWWR